MEHAALPLPSKFASDADYNDPGQDWDATPTKVVPPGGTLTQGFVPADLRLPMHDNYMNAAFIEHLNHARLTNLQFRAANTAFTSSFKACVYAGTLSEATAILVGVSAEIQTSQNLRDWTRQTAGGGYAGNFTAIAINSAGTVVVAVGSAGGIQTSTATGAAWTQRTAAGGYAGTFNDVVWDEQNSLFIAVGTGAAIQTSPDGITWTARTAGGGYAGDFRGVATDGNGIIVAVGSGVANHAQVSADGVTWTGNSPALAIVGGVGYGDGVFVWGATNDTDLYTSPDGSTWTAKALQADTNYVGTQPGFNAMRIGFDGRNLVAVGYMQSAGAGLYYSSDAGETWTYCHVEDRWTAAYLAGLAFGAGRWIFPVSDEVGDSGFYVSEVLP